MPMIALHCIPRDARQRHSDTVSVTELQRHCHKILRITHAVMCSNLEARCSMPWPFFVLVKTRPQVTRLHERRPLAHNLFIIHTTRKRYNLNTLVPRPVILFSDS